MDQSQGKQSVNPHPDQVKPVVDRFHELLQQANLGHLRVHSLTLMPAAAQPGAGPCPPGQSLQQVCEPTPEGGIHCYYRCV